MGWPRHYTDEEFSVAVSTSYSLRQVLLKLGLNAAGGNYKIARRRISKLGLDSSHFNGCGHLKGKHHHWAKKFPLENILVENSSYSSHKLRKRLIEAGVFDHKCYGCGIATWRDRKTPLEIEHKNGNNKDNRIENLTLLCPNCHALTDTYRGKNKKKYVKDKKFYFCSICNAEISKYSKNSICRSCSSKNQRRVKRPSIEELLEELKTSNFLAMGRKYGVSDNAIRKWIKSSNPIPSTII